MQLFYPIRIRDIVLQMVCKIEGCTAFPMDKLDAYQHFADAEWSVTIQGMKASMGVTDFERVSASNRGRRGDHWHIYWKGRPDVLREMVMNFKRVVPGVLYEDFTPPVSERRHWTLVQQDSVVATVSLQQALRSARQCFDSFEEDLQSLPISGCDDDESTEKKK